jgi:hypothetical protein
MYVFHCTLKTQSGHEIFSSNPVICMVLNISIILMTVIIYSIIPESPVIDFIVCEWESVELSSESVPVTSHREADMLVDAIALKLASWRGLWEKEGGLEELIWLPLRRKDIHVEILLSPFLQGLSFVSYAMLVKLVLGS